MNQKTKMRYTSEKGITLIALVITIIVLLILAGVTISMVLGDDGIIAQAQQAKKENEEATLKDEVSLAKGEAAVLQYGEQTKLTKDDLGAINEKIDEYNAGKDEDDVDYYKYENTITKITEDGVPIPVGFMHVQGTKKDTGLIVVDEYGNEYVWVPVDEVKESESENYDDEYVWLIHNDGDAQLVTGDTGKNMNEAEFAQDYENMKTSVKIYGGFYVGRYETSWTGTRVASVGNVEVMNGDTLVGESGANWYTFYTEQKKLHENSDSVVSGMIYGSQWNAIMDWMSKVPNPDSTKADKLYITDSTGMGHYQSPIAIQTGSNIEYRVKNIFDLAGNYFELTQEANSSTYRVRRGGFHVLGGSNVPVSFRNTQGDPAQEVGTISSRLQLYIK